jgi:hypothetical protein
MTVVLKSVCAAEVHFLARVCAGGKNVRREPAKWFLESGLNRPVAQISVKSFRSGDVWCWLRVAARPETTAHKRGQQSQASTNARAEARGLGRQDIHRQYVGREILADSMCPADTQERTSRTRSGGCAWEMGGVAGSTVQQEKKVWRRYRYQGR